MAKNRKKKKRKLEDGVSNLITPSPLPAVIQKVQKKERKESTSKKSKKAASIPVIDLEAKDVDVMETEEYEDYDEDCAARPCKQPTGKNFF